MGMVLLDHIFIATVAAVTLLPLTHVHKTKLTLFKMLHFKTTFFAVLFRLTAIPAP